MRGHRIAGGPRALDTHRCCRAPSRRGAVRPCTHRRTTDRDLRTVRTPVRPVVTASRAERALPTGEAPVAPPGAFSVPLFAVLGVCLSVVVPLFTVEATPD